jgi:hypothetical protein
MDEDREKIAFGLVAAAIVASYVTTKIVEKRMDRNFGYVKEALTYHNILFEAAIQKDFDHRFKDIVDDM